MKKTTDVKRSSVFVVCIFSILVSSPHVAAESLLAATDNSVGPNSTVLTIALEFSGNVLEYQVPAYYSGKAWLEFDEETQTLSGPHSHFVFSTIDFSFPVLLLRITGIVEEFETTYGYIYPTAIDPSDGSFVTSAEFQMRFLFSSYITGETIGEGDPNYISMEPIQVGGTFTARGDTDGDGLDEYELAVRGPLYFTEHAGELPLLGDTSFTISGEFDLGLVAEPLSSDGYEQDDFPEDGTFLLPGEIQSHMIHPDGDVDWIKVSVVENHEYEVMTFNLVGPSPDTVLEVYDDTGSWIAANDDYFDHWGGHYSSLVSWTAAYTGTYYVKARTYGGSGGHFDDQGGGPAFCSYDVSFPCSDLDEDGYGDPGSVLCTYPELDCDDSIVGVNPGATEILGNGIDDDCNPDTPTPWFPASVIGAEDSGTSVITNYLFVLIVPISALLVWRTVRRRA